MHPTTIVADTYPHLAPLRDGAVALTRDRFEFIDVKPVHDAFGAMVEHQRYDVCEIAVGAFFQAFGAGRPLALLPVVTLARHQHGSIYTNPRVVSLREPRDLSGRRVAVRSYSQTTGLWVRGILAEEYGLDLESVTWVTSESAHLAGFIDPPNTVRSEGASVLELLRTGQVDAAIHAPGQPVTDWCRPLIDDVERAAARYSDELGGVPINHLLCVGPEIACQPDSVADVYGAVRRSYLLSGALEDKAAGLTLDRARIVPVLERALAMAERQGLVQPGLRVEEMFVADPETAAGGER